MDHSACVPVPAGTTNTKAHTHEGEKGYWLFPSEVTNG